MRGKMHSGEERAFKSRKSRLQGHLKPQRMRNLRSLHSPGLNDPEASFYTMYSSTWPQSQPMYKRTWKLLRNPGSPCSVSFCEFLVLG